MKNKQIIILGLAVIMFMTACGNNQEQSVDTSKVSISRFEKDINTIKEEDESLLIKLSQQQAIENEKKNSDNTAYNSNEYVGELTIKNENKDYTNDNTGDEHNNEETNNEVESENSNEETDNTEESQEQDTISEVDNTQDIQLAYEINGNDIIYNSIVYTDLYLSIKEVEQQSQYDIDTLVKFILQSYPSNEQVYTFVQMYSDLGDGEGEDYNDILIDEELSNSSDMYNSICNKYNDRATWVITINKWMGKDKAMLAGCKSFTIIIGTNEDIEVDITDFN